MTGSQSFIQLHRTFSTISQRVEQDTYDTQRLPFAGERLGWAELLQRPRVVILSEAGAGKTEEIREQARRLRREGKAAFFVRLEHVADEFESSFEEGDFDSFEAWSGGIEEGWLLLDSVDEARLHSPQDFDKAIRIVARRLARAISRVHVIITSRPYAWRAQTDLRLCKRLLPVAPGSAVASPIPGSEIAGVFHPNDASQSAEDAFTIVALNDLDRAQVTSFVQQRSPGHARAFHDAVERADAWSFTTRPQDLNELLEFWAMESRIGSPLDLMRDSVRRRLIERNTNHAEARPLTFERVQTGVRLIAAACILTRIPAIRLPDSPGSVGIHIDDVLPDWSSVDQAAIVARPVFDPAIYGAVRFYHRSVREYICAEWFAHLLVSHTSRRALEQVLFREQYGLKVVVPETRAVLPWLVIFDDQICAKVLEIDPRVFFEGGDPSKLPLEVRRKILKDVVDDIVKNSSGGIIKNNGIVRFASLDLTEDIRELIELNSGSSEVLWFLLRMVWQGRLKGVLPQAKAVALDSRAERYARVAAFRAVSAVGAPSDLSDVRRAFLAESDVLDRVWLDELAAELQATPEGVDWLCEALRKAAPIEADRIDSLRDTLEALTERFPDALLIAFVDKVSELLLQPPLYERRHCEISQRFSWLVRPAAKVVAALIKHRHQDAIRQSVLVVLQMVSNSYEYNQGDVSDIKKELSILLTDWKEINWAFLWYLVDTERSWFDTAKGQRLISARFLPAWPNFVRFGPDYFNQALRYCDERSFIDDRLIALHIAFDAYKESGRKDALRRRLKAAVEHKPELRDHLSGLMRPPASDELRRMRKSQAAWDRRVRERMAFEAQKAETSRRFIEANLANEVVSPNLDPSLGITPAQRYLMDKAREHHDKTESKFSQNHWRALIAEFGEHIARGYRKAAVGHWRKSRPKLISEGAPQNTTPYSVVFGLAGLAIETIEEPDWLSGLSEADVESAFRHAMYEINGFPVWLPQLYSRFPELIRGLMVQEIAYELRTDTAEAETNYIISDVAWSGQWIWDDAASHIVDLLKDHTPNNLNNLWRLLTVLQGSSLSDASLCGLAADKARNVASLEHAATWFAVWVGVEPDVAIPATRERLAQLRDQGEAGRFTTVFVTQLVGSRYGRSSARDAYRNANSLKALYLMVREHLPEKDKGKQSTGGVSSIGLSDEAEEAQSTLLLKLRELSGKAAFTALMELAAEHPDPSYRPWLQRYAHNRAESDANGEPWSSMQIREFNYRLERTPNNHRDLFDLAVLRFEDIKYDLENGDTSEASVLMRVENETELRNSLASRLRLTAQGRYSVAQEDEYSDGKRADIRFHHPAVDGPVPAELKLSHRWSAKELFERLENQLCGDYLRDVRSSCGIFLLVHQDLQQSWKLLNGAKVDFTGLVKALAAHWTEISYRFPGVDEVRVIGIDLSLRKR